MPPFTLTTTVQRNERRSKSPRETNVPAPRPLPPVQQEERLSLWQRIKRDYFTFEQPLIWINVILIALVHIGLVLSLTFFPYIQKWRLALAATFIGIAGGFGVTAGAHRLWCHRTYKATLPMRLLLMVCFLSSGQNSIYNWVRDHRVHHKFSETEADPHNSNRGFFFSHVGWLMMRKHPEVYRRGKSVDMSDILEDPLIRFQEKYFMAIKIMIAFVLPCYIGSFCDDDFFWIFAAMIFGRYPILLNSTWCVNSAAHLFGNKPYDSRINPRENLFVSIFSIGEGWHNYHHAFPWDWRASEIGKISLTTTLLTFCKKLGLVYDMRAPTRRLVEKSIVKHGDGTYDWGDREIPEPETAEN